MGNWNKREQAIIDLSSNLVEGYLRLHQAPTRCDLIIALGSGVELTAMRTAELYRENLAPRVLLTGYGPDRKNIHLPESMNYCEKVQANGVPIQNIIIEKESTNTLQNANFSRTTLENLNIFPDSALLVVVPFHERRALATFQKQWPEVQFKITSPDIDMVLYAEHTGNSPGLIGRKVINEVKNIQKYGKKEDIIAQPFPWEMRNSYNKLNKLIFTNAPLIVRRFYSGSQSTTFSHN